MNAKVVWISILTAFLWFLASRNFDQQLSYFDVLVHCLTIVIFIIFLMFPSEELITGIGFSLDHLIESFSRINNMDALEAVCYRRAVYKTVVISIPAALSGYFVHGNLFYKPQVGNRFPGYLNCPQFHLASFVFCLAGSLIYFYHIKQYKKWNFYKFFEDAPERWNDVIEEMHGFDAVRINISVTNNKCVYFTPTYFVFISNWNIVVSRIREIHVKVKSAVHVNLHPGNTDMNYIVTLEVSFTEDYLETLLLPIRGDFYRDFADQSRVLIEIPNDPTLPSCVSQNFAENFKRMVEINNKYQYSGPALEPCFGCGGSGIKVKLSKNCNHPRNRLYFNESNEWISAPECINCNCNPLWCISCMGRIFHSKQGHVNPTAWMSGVASCPTCRNVFCLNDIHVVEEVEKIENVEAAEAVEAVEAVE